MNQNDFIQKVSDAGEVALIGPLGQGRPPSNQIPWLIVDGGRDCLNETQIKGPVFWVGDGDSSKEAQLIDLKWEPQKDFSDFKGALELLPTVDKVFCWGFLGGQREHEMANFGEGHRFVADRENTLLNFEDRVLIFPAGTHSIPIKDREFSLFVLESCQIKLGGNCHYQIKQPQLLRPLESLGLHNSA
ncbi:MAG: hypothetical protein HOM21_17420, partial [Halobacteriovoraceae bacterium]|nr:hypothetical protein [Halobacteriovoraceae bacterium]